MAINAQHPEYKENIDRWKLVDNVCSSKDTEQYLIKLNPSDRSDDNITRNKQYRERAVFYEVAGYTLRGLIGLMFGKPVKAELPQQLDYMMTNINGAGLSLLQQAQDVSADITKKGRSGLFTSYPKTDAAVSVADMNKGGYISTIHEIEADQILSWATTLIGSKIVLSSVVILEEVEEVEDYEVKSVEQIKELSLIDNVFYVTEWRKNEKDEWIIYVPAYAPTDSAGKVWNEIPFIFIGAQSNTTEVDDAPIYPLAKINIAHYRNSAEWEDSIYYSGQSQPWMSGLSQIHVDMMKENEMYIGSKQLIGVPSGEQFGFATADPNPQVRQAMLDKLDMMIGLGARFVQENGRAKTASEDNNDAKVEHSTLSLIASNVSDGYMTALGWAARYMGATGNINFEISTDFITPNATAQELQQMIAGFVQGAIPLDSYFRWMKKVDLVDEEKTIDEFSGELTNTQMPNLNG